MALACEICGKKPRYGNTISHAHNAEVTLTAADVIRVKRQNGKTREPHHCGSQSHGLPGP